MRYLRTTIDILILLLAVYVGTAWGHRQGIAEGRSMALKTNPVSPELELTCAVLWVGEQNKKYMEKK